MTRVIEVDEDYDRFIKAFRPPSDCTQHAFYECRVCGHLEWSSSRKDGPRRIVIEPLTEFEHPCPRCLEAHARAPELFKWVLAVVRRSKETPQ